jgi:hypothetical protein
LTEYGIQGRGRRALIACQIREPLAQGFSPGDSPRSPDLTAAQALETVNENGLTRFFPALKFITVEYYQAAGSKAGPATFYIDTPHGQCSWHRPEEQSVAGRPYPGKWSGVRNTDLIVRRLLGEELSTIPKAPAVETSAAMTP